MSKQLKSATPIMNSAGCLLSEAVYLDDHFAAMRPEYEYMIRQAGIQPGWTVLDAGAGGGSFLPIFNQLLGDDGHIHALDLANENVATIQRQIDLRSFTCGIDVRQGSVTQLPFTADSIDGIWCGNLVQYLTDAEFEQALVEFFRVLRPGGLLAIKEFDVTMQYIGPLDPTWWWQLLANLRKPGDRGINAVFRTIELPKWLRRAGFQNITYETVVGERRPPIQPEALHYFREFIPMWATRADRTQLSPEQIALWQRTFSDPDSPNHILNSSDFYFREGHALVVGYL